MLAQTGKDTVVVVPQKMQAPVNGAKIGAISIGNNATATHCDYEEVIAEAKNKAATMGGNVVMITELTPPAFVSKCYKIKADVYYAPGFRDSVVTQLKKQNTHKGATEPHATLFVYRLKDTIALAGSYYIRMNNDSVICETGSRSGDSLNLYKEGPVTLWAKKGERKELKLEVKFGETYYVRCGLVKDGLKQVPVIELMDKLAGAAEYTNQTRRKKNMSVKYLQEIH
jgi:hypothetical protein